MFCRIVATLSSVFLSSGAANPLPPEESTMQRVAPYSAKQQGKTENYFEIVRKIGEVFRVPISFEWSYIHDDRSEMDTPEISFAIQKGETLVSTLDRFCAATEGRLRWERLSGIICLRPTGDGGMTESLLDIPVSLQLQGVSTWEAFLELARAVNAKLPNERFLRPSVPFSDGILPPPELRDVRTVTVDVTNVTAREAACAIMAASPFKMAFWYSNFYRPDAGPSARPSSDILLWVYDEKHKLVRGPKMVTGEEIAIWWKEADSVVPKRDPAPNPTPEP
jgi:hypothetical protein